MTRRVDNNDAFEPVSTEGGNVLGDSMVKYLRAIERAEAEDYPKLMEEALQTFGHDGIFGTILVPLIASRWAEADPAGAVREFYSGRLSPLSDSDDPFSDGYGLFLSILDQALAKDPAAVREVLIENPHAELADVFLDQVVAFEARTDATRVFDTIDRLKVPGLRSFAVEAILARGNDSTLFPDGPNEQALSRKEVLALMTRYPGIMARRDRIADAFESYANRDLTGALELAEGLYPGKLREEALWGVLKEWGQPRSRSGPRPGRSNPVPGAQE